MVSSLRKAKIRRSRFVSAAANSKDVDRALVSVAGTSEGVKEGSVSVAGTFEGGVPDDLPTGASTADGGRQNYRPRVSRVTPRSARFMYA
jgi:hypothetical protein